ncbi:MAG: MBL fold metallo-hydrolase [Sediminispirochaetaceae bacterium]
MKVRVLGSGTSNGVPVVGCTCRVCSSADPLNSRTRASVLVAEGDTNILIDTATEFRLQARRAGIQSLSAVFFTHAHADHIHGLDDIRPLTYKRPLPLYAAPSTMEEIRDRFKYIFRAQQIGGGVPRVDLRVLNCGLVRCGGLEVRPVPLLHGMMPINGYRIGGFAYLTDCSSIPARSYQLLEGIDLLIIDALRYRSHPTHFNVDQALREIERISPKRAFLTHMCHDLEYHELSAVLPDGVAPAYDGLEVEVPLYK